jgi:uncharacterized protein DUF3298/peptidoglycan-N-acetylmuramic acid deacetylase PdaC-like protein
MKREIFSIFSVFNSVLLIIGLQACRHERHDVQVVATTSIKKSEKLEDPNASINTETAQLTGGDARAEKFNKIMNDFVGKKVGEFEDLARKEKEESRRKNLPGFAMDLSYVVKHSDKNLISIIYQENTFTGGAHGNSASTTFNYDLDRGEVLSLADLFNSNSNYLKVISDYCIAELRERKIGQDDWIREGAGAEMKNYERWNIVPEGLLITFDTYQVAAYVEGPQVALIPFSKLKGIIKPGGPLEGLVK